MNSAMTAQTISESRQHQEPQATLRYTWRLPATAGVGRYGR